MQRKSVSKAATDRNHLGRVFETSVTVKVNECIVMIKRMWLIVGEGVLQHPEMRCVGGRRGRKARFREDKLSHVMMKKELACILAISKDLVSRKVLPTLRPAYSWPKNSYR
jgi:hypothetical protein